MKTITTTREYDAEGRLVKETVCEQVTADPAPFMPSLPNTLPTSIPPHWQYPATVTHTNICGDVRQIAKDLSRLSRQTGRSVLV